MLPAAVCAGLWQGVDGWWGDSAVSWTITARTTLDLLSKSPFLIKDALHRHQQLLS